MLNILFLAIVAVGILVVVLPIALIVYGIVKKKRRLTVITSVVTGLCVAAVCVYQLLFPTHYPYVDLWVNGRQREAIVEKYGEPDYENGKTIGYCIGRDNGFFGGMSSNNDFYYYIYFDEDGTACEVEKRIQFGG